jgi:hypothetical protein
MGHSLFPVSSVQVKEAKPVFICGTLQNKPSLSFVKLPYILWQPYSVVFGNWWPDWSSLVLFIFVGEHGENSDTERRDILSMTEIMLTLSNKFEVQEDEKKDQKNMLIR